MDGWVGGWVDVKVDLRIAYSNKKLSKSDVGKGRDENPIKSMFLGWRMDGLM